MEDHEVVLIRTRAKATQRGLCSQERLRFGLGLGLVSGLEQILSVRVRVRAKVRVRVRRVRVKVKVRVRLGRGSGWISFSGHAKLST